MKKQIKSLLLVVLLASYCLPALAQSTEGKEFWVGLTWAVTPPDGEKGKETTSSYYQTAKPYIAVSAKEKGTLIQLTNPAFPNWSVSYTTQEENEWHEFKTDDIPYQYWYPSDMKTIADFSKYADVKKPWGIKVNSSHNISVYAVVRADYGMDASNILPTTALRSEYYLQDFYPEYHLDGVNFSGPAITMATILATEDNTKIDIYPTGNTYGKNNSGGSIPTITLNKGEIYYLLGADKALISGTRIIAQDNKPIAVFIGDPITRLPAAVGARDALYEQAMPTDFWGTQFVVTRSLEKDANFIGITATMPGTQIFLDGSSSPVPINEGRGLNSGETYWIELYSPLTDNNPYTKNANKLSYTNEVTHISQDALYIESSCPVAVYSYDTGNSYKGSKTENTSNHGDPSSVWIAPIQQKIKKITFGTCTTSKTKAHFLNIVTETASCQNTSLTGYYFANNRTFPVDISDSITWNPVDGNAKLSYARVKLEAKDASGQAALPLDVFTMENTSGFIANVYGNGEDESYAYSVGSAAVEQGVIVEGETFTEGNRSENKFCLNKPLQFDSKVGTDEITRVDWTFGDGTSEYNGMPQIEHTYTSPGWYDVTAKLFGQQVCTNVSNVELGTVHFTFRVAPPDTLYMDPEHRCISVDSIYDGRKLTAEEIAKMIANGGNDTVKVDPDDCASEVHITPISYGMDTEEKLDTITGEDMAVGYNGSTYYVSTDVIDTIPATVNRCAIYRKYYVKVISCLGMTVTNDSAAQHVCPNNTLEIEYTKTKGDAGKAQFVIPGILEEEIDLSNDNTLMGKISLPTQNLKPGLYKGQLKVEDLYCSDKTFPIDVAVYYPDSIFQYKFNNVLAVYKKGFGGNEYCDLSEYTFQWYRNYMPIEGATKSVLYLGDSITFAIGDEVHVALTDKKGVTIPSCSQTILTVPDYNKPETENAPARKMIINNQFVILKGESTYDIYGQKVQ